MVASQAKRRQKEATNANWIRVRVAGLGKALRMAFEDVLVRALDMYQIMQSIYILNQHLNLFCEEGLRTINLGETGAFKASPISCTFAVTLAFLVRMVLKASLKLFCLLCLPPVLGGPLFHPDPLSILSLLGCHLSPEGVPLGIPLFALVGLDG
jgi:hypothetical protein